MLSPAPVRRQGFRTQLSFPRLLSDPSLRVTKACYIRGAMATTVADSGTRPGKYWVALRGSSPGSNPVLQPPSSGVFIARQKWVDSPLFLLPANCRDDLHRDDLHRDCLHRDCLHRDCLQCSGLQCSGLQCSGLQCSGLRLRLSLGPGFLAKAQA